MIRAPFSSSPFHLTPLSHPPASWVRTLNCLVINCRGLEVSPLLWYFAPLWRDVIKYLLRGKCGSGGVVWIYIHLLCVLEWCSYAFWIPLLTKKSEKTEVSDALYLLTYLVYKQVWNFESASVARVYHTHFARRAGRRMSQVRFPGGSQLFSASGFYGDDSALWGQWVVV